MMTYTSTGKIILAALLLLGSFNTTTTHGLQGIHCTKDFLKEHKTLQISLVVGLAIASMLKPTQGEYDLSRELFLQDPVTWSRNFLGWFSKDPKLKSIDKTTGTPIYKHGYEAQGLIGYFESGVKTVTKPFAGFTNFTKDLDPLCLSLSVIAAYILSSQETV